MAAPTFQNAISRCQPGLPPHTDLSAPRNENAVWTMNDETNAARQMIRKISGQSIQGGPPMRSSYDGIGSIHEFPGAKTQNKHNQSAFGYIATEELFCRVKLMSRMTATSGLPKTICGGG